MSQFCSVGKMAEKWENWPKNGPKMAFFRFSAIFAPMGPKSIFRPFFEPISGPKPERSVQGNRDCKSRDVAVHFHILDDRLSECLFHLFSWHSPMCDDWNRVQS